MYPPRKRPTSNFKRILARMLLALIALFILASGIDVTPAHSLTESNRAGLVVVHSNGQVVKQCVLFTESQISGLDLLTRAGLDLNADASNPTGVAVCRLDREIARAHLLDQLELHPDRLASLGEALDIGNANLRCKPYQHGAIVNAKASNAGILSN